MRHRNRLLALVVVQCVIFGLITQFLPKTGQAQTVAPALFSVETDADGVTVTFRVEQFSIATIDDQHTTHIVADDMPMSDAPYLPALPTFGILVGVPTHENLQLRVMRSDEEQVILPHAIAVVDPPLVPADLQLDDVVGAPLMGSRPAPIETRTESVQIGSVGKMRDQHFVQIQFNPVVYLSGTLEAMLHHAVTARLTWDASAVDRSAPIQHHAAYESLIGQSLVNAADLNRPKPAPAHRPMTPRAIQTTQADQHPALRLTIPEDGIYQVTGADIAAAGWALDTLSPTHIALSHRDVLVPHVLELGGEGRLDEADTITFYATGYEDLFVDENVYWLTVTETAMMPMQTVDGTPQYDGNADAYRRVVHAEEDTNYWRGMLDGEGKDHWFWGARLSPNSSGLDSQRDYLIDTYALANSDGATATLKLVLHGYTALDHLTRIAVNGTPVVTVSWRGQDVITPHVSFPQSLLTDVTSAITVEALDAGAVVDQYYVNWIELEYDALFSAENDSISFIPPSSTVTLTGFTDSAEYIFNISNPLSPTRIISSQIDNGTEYLVALQPPHDAKAIVAVSESAILSASNIISDTASDLKSTANRADYIIITYGEFADAAQRLADHRSAQGLVTMVVDVQDIYDEFNGGLLSTYAIRDFLHHAYSNWSAPAPTYVVFLGDAFQDFKDDLGTGTLNYVPSHLIESDLYGQVPSDNWFVTLEGDDAIAELFAGRLSAQTVGQAHTIVDKLIAYDSQEAAGKALFVADDDTTTFESTSETVIQTFPASYAIERVFASAYPPDNPTDAITITINAGVDVVNYFGHGNFENWGRWDEESTFFFNKDYVPSLNNASNYALFTIGNCLNGFFATVGSRPSVAELLQRQTNGGSIAVWSATSLGYTSGHRILIGEFYDSAFDEVSLPIGSHTAKAATATLGQSTYWTEMINTFILFGDPASTMNTDESVPLSLALQQTHLASNGLSQSTSVALVLLAITATVAVMKLRLRRARDCS